MSVDVVVSASPFGSPEEHCPSAPPVPGVGGRFLEVLWQQLRIADLL